jgi:arylsulfatase A-like enzyme
MNSDQTKAAGMDGLSRRRLLQAAGVVAAGAAATSAASGTAQAAPLAPFRPRGRLRRRPNFLIIMVDEQRDAPVYESERLKAWRAANLPSQNLIRRNGMEFAQHHIMSAACQPSRASIYTGQYPSLHGVSQTSGAAKTAIEQDLYWLEPGTVPTLGSWFRAAGYDTFWKGKWHVSDADLYQPGSYQPIPSYTDSGARDPYLEELYIESAMLEQYGFNGFVGPEPHGSNPLNSGSSGPNGRGRDQVYAQMGVEQLRKLRNAQKPWLLVTSFVNPHDITLWGDLTVAANLSGAAGSFYLAQQLQGSNVPADLFTELYRRSANEDMSTKPTAQESFIDQYPKGFQPLRNGLEYHRFYYQLQKEVDQHIGQVMAELVSQRNQYRDTIVIYLSDHGEMLGAHGGMFQKWHNAYDEVVKVPLVFHNPQLFPEAQRSDVLTSHADLIPTMLGLAGADEKVLAKSLRSSHSQVQPLPGRDLSSFLLGEEDDTRFRGDAVYFMTDDQPFKGANAVSVLGNTYQPVNQPNCVETVVTYLPTGPQGERQRWKYTRYWDNPQFWTTPNVQDVQTFIPGPVNQPGTKQAITTVKAINPTAGQSPPAADQYELYNVTADPAELTNLYGDSQYANQLSIMQQLLAVQAKTKRLTPIQQPWADGSAQQFPFTPS